MNQAATMRAFAPGYAPTGISGREQALARFETAAEDTAAAAARRRSNKALRRAIAAWKRGEAPRAAEFALKATALDDGNPQAFHLLAIALEKLGHTREALATYERAFALDPDDPDLPLNLGFTAWKLDMLDGAERMFRLCIEKRPDHPAAYNNLGSIQRDRGDLSLAIETLRGAIYRMPGEPALWNTLATVLAEEGRAEESLVFYGEALRLDPRLARVWHNLGYAQVHVGQMNEALASYDSALALTDHVNERIEGRHSRSICLIGLGRLAEGFREYEVRLDPDFRGFVLHYTKSPRWNGEPLAGKRLLLVGEQGLGDEIMFANVIPDLARAVGPEGHLQIALQPRLVSLFARSFPQAEIGPYQDGKLENKYVRYFPWATKGGEPDFHALLATSLQFLRTRVEDFPRRAFLVPDAAKMAEFRARLAALGPGPYVGICWRSMMLGVKRKKYYSPIESWAPVFAMPGVTFVNLQYGDCREELKLARDKLGATIHEFADLDLKDDIDGCAALSAACDLVISAPTAVAALAGSVGTETWFVASGRVWPQLGTDHYPWYRASRVFYPEKFADWNALMPRISEALEIFAREKAGAASARDGAGNG